VHVEKVSESHSAHDQANPPPGFTHANLDGLDKDDQLFVQFIAARVEEIGATQTISQKLTEASGGSLSKHFEEIVAQPYQEFHDVFTKESFDELPDWKQWDHTIELVPDAHNFSTKVYLLAPVKQKQLMNSSMRILRANAYTCRSCPWHPQS